MSLPNPVEQKSYDVINNKLSRVMKEVAEESMKRAAVEENSSSPDNLLTVSGDGTWKTRGHSSLIGVCTVIGAETDLSIRTPEEMFRREIWLEKLTEMFVCPWLNVTIVDLTPRHRGVYSHFLGSSQSQEIKRVKKLSCFRNRK
ncbi:hypothetical protein TNCV_3847641, partial [Trichonephila clavipes]